MKVFIIRLERDSTETAYVRVAATSEADASAQALTLSASEGDVEYAPDLFPVKSEPRVIDVREVRNGAQG